MCRCKYSKFALVVVGVSLCLSAWSDVARGQYYGRRPYEGGGYWQGRREQPSFGGNTYARGGNTYNRGGYMPGYYGSGYGGNSYDLSGFTNPIAARGQYNLDTAQAMEAMEQASHQSIENHNFAVQSYYNNRNIHDQYMLAQYSKDHVNQSEANYFAQELSPGRLSAAQIDRATGVIHWPPLLRDKQFSDARYKLDQLFHNRTPSNSGADSDNYGNIKKACDAMEKTLDSMKELASEEYIGANHFIRSLSYEGQFAAK